MVIMVPNFTHQEELLNVCTVVHFVVHLLATDCIVTTNVLTLPYKIVYLDNKLLTATMHGCNYNMQFVCMYVAALVV